MSECLGLFVEENLIKYAKLSKENDMLKVQNFGMKFYDQDLEKNIKQIIEETYSYKTPISINISNERYTNVEIFGLLSDTDQKKSIQTEFEYFCNETGKNKLTLDYRTILSEKVNEDDKKNVLFVYAEKGSIAEKIQLLDSYRLENVSPVSIAISELQTNETNSLIVNIENRTEVTTIINGKPTKVDIIENGMREILKSISYKENSFNKSYEICKNTTLYTTNSQNLQFESNEYLEVIVPSIYKICEELSKIIEKNKVNIEKIYITGMGASINNIDLYFQENFLNYKCEILTPYFIDKTKIKINIKDYIEVNSAIALAAQVLNKNNKNVNFDTRTEVWSKIRELLKSDVKTLGKKTYKSKNARNGIDFTLRDVDCIRFLYSTLIILVLYIIITVIISRGINNKKILAQELIDDTKTKTDQINNYTSLIEARTQNYESVLEQLQEANDRITQKYKSRNAIPNLLNEIMFAIPKEAQIVSIKNTNGNHVIIEAQSSEYQYLGYFKSELQNRAILINVTSTSGTRIDEMIRVTIEGDLPY